MKFFLIPAFAFTLSCLPKEAGGVDQFEKSREAQEKKCGVEFNRGDSLRQIALTAQKIRTECALTENKVLALAKKTFN